MINSPLEKLRKIKKLNDRTVKITKRNAVLTLANGSTYIILMALSVVFLVPFLYIATQSLMSSQDLANPNVQWIPKYITFDNYKFAFQILEYPRRLALSAFITMVSMFGQLFSCSFVAYGISRIKFKGAGVLFSIIMFTMIIPPQSIIVSQYLMFSKYEMLDSYLPVILPCFFALGLNGGMFIFLFRQFFKSIPNELENAAYIDGSGIMGTYFRVIIPNSGAAILVVTILSTIWQWNNFFEPSVYVTDVSKYTLTMLLSDLGSQAAQINLWVNNGVDLAATFLCLFPLLLLFFFLQKKFIKGIETTGLAN